MYEIKELTDRYIENVAIWDQDGLHTLLNTAIISVMCALLGLTIGLLPISASGQDALERELDAYARTGCV